MMGGIKQQLRKAAKNKLMCFSSSALTGDFLQHTEQQRWLQRNQLWRRHHATRPEGAGPTSKKKTELGTARRCGVCYRPITSQINPFVTVVVSGIENIWLRILSKSVFTPHPLAWGENAWPTHSLGWKESDSTPPAHKTNSLISSTVAGLAVQ